MLEYDKGVPGFSVSSVRSQKAIVKESMSGMFCTLEEDVAARIGNDKSKLEHNPTKTKTNKQTKVMALFQTQFEVRKRTF